MSLQELEIYVRSSSPLVFLEPDEYIPEFWVFLVEIQDLPAILRFFRLIYRTLAIDFGEKIAI